MPLTVGGGVSKLDDFRLLLSNGADKISINTEAFLNHGLISEAAERYGSQCVVVSIDYKKDSDGACYVYTHCGKNKTQMHPVEWATMAEKLGAAEAAAEVARQDAASKRVQSAAAKLLCEVMEAQRDAERARYVAPFQEKVQSLSRTVFGDGCSVQISDNLEIESRTLDGRTVPFDSLSGGAKEQLGIIARLACAILAASEGGVPVVLDDAFGWSDPDRVERLGALLGVAGRTCQVVLLTCDPGRGLGIAGAKVVKLG